MKDKLKKEKEPIFYQFIRLTLAVIGLYLIVRLTANPWFLEYQEYMGWRVGEEYWLTLDEEIGFWKWLFNR